SLSPDELLVRAKRASPAEKKLLEKIAGDDNRSVLGWGPVQIYFRLSASELQALRAGEELYFSEGPRPGERPLPPDVARGVLQGWRGERLRKDGEAYHLADGSDPDAVPV